LWLLVVLGAVALAVIVYLAARHGSRRAATAASWRSGVADASAKGWALSDAVGMAQAPAESAPGTASVRWADIQRRADDLAQTLYALRERAPGDLESGRVDDVLAALQGLRSAMNAEAGPSDPSTQDHARIRSRLAAFEAALNALHQPDPYKI
jgi:hypothetical protein